LTVLCCRWNKRTQPTVEISCCRNKMLDFKNWWAKLFLSICLVWHDRVVYEESELQRLPSLLLLSCSKSCVLSYHGSNTPHSTRKQTKNWGDFYSFHVWNQMCQKKNSDKQTINYNSFSIHRILKISSKIYRIQNLDAYLNYI
jgi:hypothetical protein